MQFSPSTVVQAVRLAPFALVAALPVVLAVLPPEGDAGLLGLSVLVTVGVALTVILTPWERVPLWFQAVPTLLYCLGVAVAREAGGGGQSGLALLLLLPVLWHALYGTRRLLLVSLVGATAALVVPSS
ncbi:hypothetical protein BH18ACT1_BH18ACT1_01700 [soil metagenome]